MDQQRLAKDGTLLHVDMGRPDLPTVVFVHNMWGSHRSLLRHARFMNELGHTTVRFDLYKSSEMKDTLSLRFERPLQFLYLTLIDQIDSVLDSVPGPKILYAFSGPSLCALIAAQERNDIQAFICDGGPFQKLWKCTRRMYAQLSRMPSWMQGPLTSLSVWFWGTRAFSHLRESLARWNPHVPILSLRGLKDSIVYPENIAGAFEGLTLPLTVAELPQSGHLDGLKREPELYRSIVQKFLQGHPRN